MLSRSVAGGATDLRLVFMEDMDTIPVLPFTYHFLFHKWESNA
jgi:hypothetical protein